MHGYTSRDSGVALISRRGRLRPVSFFVASQTGTVQQARLHKSGHETRFYNSRLSGWLRRFASNVWDLWLVFPGRGIFGSTSRGIVGDFDFSPVVSETWELGRDHYKPNETQMSTNTNKPTARQTGLNNCTCTTPGIPAARGKPSTVVLGSALRKILTIKRSKCNSQRGS